VNTGKRIFLRWVPGHVGIRGNEQADDIAEMAVNSYISALKHTVSDCMMTYSDILVLTFVSLLVCI